MTNRFHLSNPVTNARSVLGPLCLRLPLTGGRLGAGILPYNFSLLRKKIVRQSGNTAWMGKILKRLVDPFPGRQAGCSRPPTLGIGLADPGATTFTTNNQSHHLKRRTA